MMKIIKIILAVLLATNLSSKTVCFLYAMDEDWQQFRDVFDRPVQQETVNGQVVSSIKTDTMTIYGVKMGSGVVQTAISTQRILSHATPDLVISVGPIGSLHNEIKVEGIYLVHEVVPWQSTQSLQTASPSSFSKVTPAPPPGDWKPLLTPYPQITVASGDAFISSSTIRAAIHSATHAKAVDMNLYGLVLACNQQHVPSLHLRIISDRANENAGKEFQQFRNAYDGTLGKKAAEWLTSMPKDPTHPDNYPHLKKILGEQTDTDHE